MTCYSVQPRDRMFVEGYGFLSFAKYTGRNLSSKYSQQILYHDTDAFKTDSKRTIQKTAEVTSELLIKSGIKLLIKL